MDGIKHDFHWHYEWDEMNLLCSYAYMKSDQQITAMKLYKWGEGQYFYLFLYASKRI